MTNRKQTIVKALAAVMTFSTFLTSAHAEEEQAVVTKVTEANTFEKTAYYQSNPLGIAGNFHLVGFNSVSTNAHTNGNILTKTLYYGSNFGTNGYSGEISYIQNIGNEISSFQFSGDPNKVLVVGRNVTVGTTDNDTAWTLNGAKLDNPNYANYSSNLWQDDTADFINIDAVQQEMISVNQTMKSYADCGIEKNLSDQNNQTVTILNQDTANVINLTPGDYVYGNMLNVTGFERGKNSTLIINMDLSGIQNFSFAGSEIIYTDGTSASHGEVTQWQDGNVIWNFYDSSDASGLYRGSISNTRATAGLIIAPCATVNLTQNFNGTVIANDIIVSAESHRTDFTGKTIVPTETQTKDQQQGCKNVEVTISTEWEKADETADDVTFNLLADGELVETVTLNEENNWTYTCSNLKECSETSEEITYSVSQTNETEEYITEEDTEHTTTTEFHFKSRKKVTKVEQPKETVEEKKEETVEEPKETVEEKKEETVEQPKETVEEKKEETVEQPKETVEEKKEETVEQPEETVEEKKEEETVEEKQEETVQEETTEEKKEEVTEQPKETIEEETTSEEGKTTEESTSDTSEKTVEEPKETTKVNEPGKVVEPRRYYSVNAGSTTPSTPTESVKTTKTARTVIPDTGDHSNAALYAGILVISAVMATAIIVVKKQYSK